MCIVQIILRKYNMLANDIFHNRLTFLCHLIYSVHFWYNMEEPMVIVKGIQ